MAPILVAALNICLDSTRSGLLGVLLGDSLIDFRGNHADAAHNAHNARYTVKRELQTREFVPPP